MEHLSQEDIVRYRARSLDAAGVLRVSDHLSECESCRARILAIAHLSYDEIAAYVDGAMSGDDARMARSHLRVCTTCAADVRGIEALKAEIGAPPEPSPRAGERASWWRLLQGWRALWVLAAAGACVLIVFAIRQKGPRMVAEVPAPVQPAARVETPAATVIHDGARSITVTADGTLAGLDGLPDSLRNAVGQSLSTGKIPVPTTLAELASQRTVLMGSPATGARAALLEPLGVMLESQRPEFRWQRVPGAEYQVSVYSTEFKPVATSDWIQQAQWKPAADLHRGARYLWQLTVRLGGSEFTVPEPPAPEARFQVLDAAAEAELARVKSERSDSHLVLGVAYAQAGLLNEAGRELRAAAEENPGNAVVANLLASVNRMEVNPAQRQSK